jgi:hypothetical protein
MGCEEGDAIFPRKTLIRQYFFSNLILIHD